MREDYAGWHKTSGGWVWMCGHRGFGGVQTVYTHEANGMTDIRPYS